jgi:hypothetical protein
LKSFFYFSHISSPLRLLLLCNVTASLHYIIISISFLPAAAAAAAAATKSLIGSSFISTPTDGNGHFFESKLRTRVKPKPRYAEEWRKRLHLYPQNSAYSVEYSQSLKIFQISKCGQGISNDERVVYSCEGTNQHIKSAFFAFGLHNYDMKQFLEGLQDSPVVLLENLSPENISNV